MIRLLRETDSQDYYNLLNQLTQVGTVTDEQFEEFVNSQNDRFSVLVWEEDSKIVACVTFLIEQKIQRSYSSVMHIEDVVTDNNYRGRGISKKLLEKAKEIAKDKSCYKIILDCSESNIAFYQKLGFIQKEYQMVYRF
jgi:glucosamine-phosphate N-acetyltransferase